MYRFFESGKEWECIKNRHIGKKLFESRKYSGKWSVFIECFFLVSKWSIGLDVDIIILVEFVKLVNAINAQYGIVYTGIILSLIF